MYINIQLSFLFADQQVPENSKNSVYVCQTIVALNADLDLMIIPLAV